MAIRFHSTASRHGINERRAIYVIEHYRARLYSDRDDERDLVVFLGVDDRGVPLEVIGLSWRMATCS